MPALSICTMPANAGIVNATQISLLHTCLPVEPAEAMLVRVARLVNLGTLSSSRC